MLKEQGRQVGHEDDDIHFGLAGKARKLNEDMHTVYCVLDNMDCEGKPWKVKNHMVDEET